MSYTLQVRAADHKADPYIYGSTVRIDLSSIIPPERDLSSVVIRKLSVPNILYNVLSANLPIDNDSPWRKGTQDPLTGVITPDPVTAGPTYLDPAYINNVFDIAYDISGTVYTAALSIPFGYYKSTDLFTMLRDAIALGTAPSLALTFSFDTRTFRTKITSTNMGLNSITFNGKADTRTMPLPTDARLKLLVPSLPRMLGCLADQDTISFITDSGLRVGFSSGPLNVVKDRTICVTCDEVKGLRAAIDPVVSLVDTPWVEGTLVFFPFTGGPGDIMRYEPLYDTPWIRINSKKTRTLTLRICREFYPIFGPIQIDWSMMLEIR
jgi:hypothetical protein